MKTFRSNGKLLLTGEYVVLDGALSLAIPTKYGQSLIVKHSSTENSMLAWQSFNEAKKLWFEGIFQINKNIIFSETTNNDVTTRLLEILQETKNLNPTFLNESYNFKIETHLDFPTNWGLGTSSTLINNIAQWANVDAHKLLKNTFGGSGYDIACAKNNTPITYSLEQNQPTTEKANFNPEFKNNLYFVHLNKKQNSRDGIKHYHEHKANAQYAIREINNITRNMVDCKTLETFKQLMVKHETIISKITKQTVVKNLLFKDFNGAIKSLGAWGGDFIMIATNENPVDYFKNRGYNTIIKYSDMVI